MASLQGVQPRQSYSSLLWEGQLNTFPQRPNLLNSLFVGLHEMAIFLGLKPLTFLLVISIIYVTTNATTVKRVSYGLLTFIGILANKIANKKI